MRFHTLIDTLEQVKNDSYLKCKTELIDRSFWAQAQVVFKRVSSEQKIAILDALCHWANKQDVLITPGLELFIPVLWECLVLNHECSGRAQQILHFLSRLISDHPDVRFAETLVPMLTATLHYIWTNPLDTSEDVNFVSILIAQSRKETVSLEFCCSTVLQTLTVTLSDNDQHVWKRLLLIARLIGALHPITSRQPLPDWLKPVAKFSVQCLQVKRISQSGPCRYVTFELLVALSRYTYDSLDWLRPLCVPDGTVEPLVVVLITVSVEIRLGLHQLHGGALQSQNDEKISRQYENPHQGLSASAVNQRVLGNTSELLRFGLLIMKHANSISDSESSSTSSMFHLITDDAAQGLWCQLMDVGDALKEYFQSMSTISSYASHSDEGRKLNASLLSAYIAWLEVYYQTHHDEIVIESKDADMMKQRLTELYGLMKKDLHPIGSILWFELSSYFCGSDSCPKTIIERCIASLEFLCGLVPGHSILPYDYRVDLNSTTLGSQISNWIWSLWTTLEENHTKWEIMLCVLVTINNAWLNESFRSFKSTSQSELMRWIKDHRSLLDRLIMDDDLRLLVDNRDIRLDLGVESLILCLLGVTAENEETDGSVQGNSLKLEKIMIVSEKYLCTLKSRSATLNEGALDSLAKRLRTALQNCAHVQPVLRSLISSP